MIAARPRGREIIRAMLEDSFDIVEAHTMADAFATLEAKPRQVDLILATLAFDESRMIEFLEAVKRDRKLREIPFFCCRVVKSVVSDELTGMMADVCKECGAEDFADVANLSRAAGAKVLKKMLGG